jgi:outer membrane lipopolysaccharide assembly protein LptE/RlpB
MKLFKYHYKMQFPYPGVDSLVTGTVQVSREYSDAEVEALAKEMHHGRCNNAKLIEVVRVEE